jgi:branched-chain amino acid transport system ATP-binding protein
VSLSVHGVSVRFGGLSALDDVSFAVPDRSVVGVIGPNGAGKTTIFNVICGFVRPTSGTITWDGRPLTRRPDRLAASGISRTLQAVGLFADLTALENVMVGGASVQRAGFASALLALPRSDRSERELRERAMAELRRLDVADVAGKRAATLPYPVQKRVALARALMSKPRLLMLDEPGGGLGGPDMDALADLIRALPRDEQTPCSVLLVEHHMDLVMSVCDHVVVLDFGKKVAEGTPDQIRNDPAVAVAYLGADVPIASGE